MNFLEKVKIEKKKEIGRAKKKLPLDSFRNKLRKSSRSFKQAVSSKKRKKIKLIAEIKRASPSKGLIKKDFNVKEIAKLYNIYADAISVLTDEKFFKGKKEYLQIARKNSKLPVLRKDFIIDEYQVYESKYYGADAVLLIADLLPKEKINSFIKIARRLGMGCLVEAECAASLKKVLDTDAEIIGINNRDLHSLKVDFNKTAKLLKLIPKNKLKNLVLISESGIESRQDIGELKGRIDAVLVGSALMEAKNTETKLKELTGKTLVKVCGITNKGDAENAIKFGADFLGFNFYPKSPRYINPKKARRIITALPKNVYIVGVFVNPNKKQLNSLAKYCSLDFFQFSGDEKLGICKGLIRPCIKAIRVKDGKDLKGINRFNTQFILLDAFAEGLYGGTGKQFNYKLLEKLPEDKLYFIAGGINPKNVKMVIRETMPFAVDVCSGIESVPGKKSLNRMVKLFKEVV